jgi:dTMP kinase
MPKERGRLILIEGIDAAGKDTQIKRLVPFLQRRGEVKVVHYPDKKSETGKLICGFLEGRYEFSPETQFLLYAADMLKDRERIKKWLHEGKTVILNRYITSSLAYQGAQGFSLERGEKFVGLFRFPRPDAIIYLRISASASVERKSRQKGSLDRFEAGRGLQERVAGIYSRLAKDSFMGKWIVVDGEKPEEKVFREITRALS